MNKKLFLLILLIFATTICSIEKGSENEQQQTIEATRCKDDNCQTMCDSHIAEIYAQKYVKILKYVMNILGFDNALNSIKKILKDTRVKDVEGHYQYGPHIFNPSSNRIIYNQGKIYNIVHDIYCKRT